MGEKNFTQFRPILAKKPSLNTEIVYCWKEHLKRNPVIPIKPHTIDWYTEFRIIDKLQATRATQGVNPRTTGDKEMTRALSPVVDTWWQRELLSRSCRRVQFRPRSVTPLALLADDDGDESVAGSILGGAGPGRAGPLQIELSSSFASERGSPARSGGNSICGLLLNNCSNFPRGTHYPGEPCASFRPPPAVLGLSLAAITTLLCSKREPLLQACSNHGNDDGHDQDDIDGAASCYADVPARVPNEISEAREIFFALSPVGGTGARQGALTGAGVWVVGRSEG
ncbi:hypothetical protein PR048_003069 [Dryococelus australis]|uniref:Uncharacterized protein n=1 Tax=Dryococelus australis TaxID=614101 RepID=A0ABQ9IM54_9NEOP|nr:hypothetical protein PR048_003069 [Dryococelus australis]